VVGIGGADLGDGHRVPVPEAVDDRTHTPTTIFQRSSLGQPEVEPQCDGVHPPILP
jgi:hypothetical protein